MYSIEKSQEFGHTAEKVQNLPNFNGKNYSCSASANVQWGINAKNHLWKRRFVVGAIYWSLDSNGQTHAFVPKRTLKKKHCFIMFHHFYLHSLLLWNRMTMIQQCRLMRKNAQIGSRSANFAEWSNRTVVGAVHGCVHQASQFLRCSLLWTFLNHPPPAERLWSCYSTEHEEIKEMTVPVDINGRIKQHQITGKDWRHVNFYNDICIKSSLYRVCQCQTF